MFIYLNIPIFLHLVWKCVCVTVIMGSFCVVIFIVSPSICVYVRMCVLPGLFDASLHFCSVFACVCVLFAFAPYMSILKAFCLHFANTLPSHFKVEATKWIGFFLSFYCCYFRKICYRFHFKHALWLCECTRALNQCTCTRKIPK